MSKAHGFIVHCGLAALLSGCGSHASPRDAAMGGSTGGTNTSGSGGAGGAVFSGGTPAGGARTGGAVETGGAQTGGIIRTGGIAAGGNAASGGSGSGGSGGAGGKATGGGVGTGGIIIASGGAGGVGAGGQLGTGGMTCPTPPPTGETYTADAKGVTFTVGTGRLRLQICKEDIIRVQYTTASALPAKTSLAVNNTWATSPTFCVAESAGTVTITTSRIKAKVNTSTGVVSYTDPTDKLILAEDSKSLSAATISGTSTNKVQATFSSPADEGLFGLGQHQDGVVNKKGAKSIHFKNVNNNVASSATAGGDITIPLLVSSKGYGVFWDNAAEGDFYGDDSSNTKYRFSSNAGDMVDYYFLYGPTIDQVIGLYRTATGAAPLFPKWAYGLFQSKDKYTTQAELLAVKDGYRKANIPVDCIVQDWEYWLPYVQGSHLMNTTSYPDPAKLVSDMHAANVHTMISIWPRYALASPEKIAGENANYTALNNIKALFLGGTPGYPPPYDTQSSEARTLVYQQIYDRLLGKYGWDGIWADATEPEGIDLNTVTTAIGKGFLYFNAYPLGHSRALYEGWRKVGPDKKRVYVLTRSGFAGQQRYAASCWSGDIGSDQVTYVRQIPAGLGFAISGMPYWTTDIGGYFGHSTTWSTAQNNELFTRWFQYGAFCPLFRIHGGGAREMYGNQWSAATKANLLAVDNLRYRLMPYIYSLAWKVTNESYTIMRPLVFDYQNDPTVFGIKDQFMFGPAFLVNPVISAGATNRSVYLPAGTWYDFWTGTTKEGGTKVTVDAPLSQIPLFIRAGSIVPMGPKIQYATESIDPLEIRVYKGKDASFTLYEDEGDTYNYETGQHAQITFEWKDSTQQLSIGARSGSYTGMPKSRTFHIVWVGANHGSGVEAAETADQVVTYDGAATVVTAK